MQTVLITGGAGFIGSNLAKQLLSKRYNVIVLDTLSPQIHGTNPSEDSFLYKSIANEVNFIKGSVTDEKILNKLVNEVDYIIHLAAETGTGQSMYELERYSNINVGGTSLLLDILANSPNNVKKVIVASSRSIYGEGKYTDRNGNIYYPRARSIEKMKEGDFNIYDESGKICLQLMPTPEDSTPAPGSFYAITKLFQEQSVLLICKSIGIDAVALRFQNVYGPGQSLKNPYTGLLAVFSNLIRQGKNINVFEDGQESRDFIYVDDVIDAIVKSLETDKINGMALNVGTGVPTSVFEVATILKTLYNANIDINISGDFRIGDIRHNYADISKIKELLNFEPKVDIYEGLKRFVNWVQEQPNEDYSLFEKSVKEMKGKNMFISKNLKIKLFQ